MLIPNVFTAIAVLSTLVTAVPLPSNINTLQLSERSAINVPTTIVVDQGALSKRLWYPQGGAMLQTLKGLPQTIRGKLFGKPQPKPQPKPQHAPTPQRSKDGFADAPTSPKGGPKQDGPDGDSYWSEGFQFFEPKSPKSWREMQ